ncbi:transporter substrate-binding domain-containing protein [Aquitalea magnusonii]|uniref:Amino acid ABC transporter substrate-binding protein (PAAT family) n=1 Tax=Aquitalea magnusonii TaxID=332411 RepID=A0A318JJ04_9NEIS|nr:transporter substrate-binding domain-containing protein [Aquitalea magnusonii]PXX51022.1 amino acid ABC transporter substrate-binding protein (PAAT family) [Aquitalea magnusonii]
MFQRQTKITNTIAALALLAAGHSHAGATLDHVQKSGVLRGVLLESYPPFSFLNSKNQLDGFDVDVAKAVAKKLGVKLKLDTPSWEVIAAGKWGARWDICICSMTPNKERAQVLDFPAFYYNSPAVLIANVADKKTSSIKSLEGKKIAVQQGSSYESYLQKKLTIEAPNAVQPAYPFNKVVIAPYDNEELAFQDLALGAGKRVDAVISNLVTANERISKTGKFRIVGSPLYQEPNWVAVDKGDAQWNARVKQVISELKKDGTLSAISKKWIGSDITN